MEDGFAFAMIDATDALGHFIELYEPVKSLAGFYAMVARAAQKPDRGELLRDISLG
jgi:hypothetical protein